MGRDRKSGGTVAAHIRLDITLLNSPAYIALDACAKALLIDLRAKVNTYNNGNISAALSELKHRGWRSAVTLAKSIRQLEAVGLLAKTRQTIGVERGSKVCNLYRFTDLDVYEQSKVHVAAQSATHDYKKFESLAAARQAVATASAAKPRTKKTSLQKVKRDATDSRASTTSIATDSVVTFNE
jgi:hypothetical protein